jgi:tellurite methyltransferase
MHPDAKKWNNRYLEEGEDWLEKSPRQLLLDYAELLPTDGLGLDAAAGVANNGTFLAQRGLKVIALDISETALRLAMERAREKKLPISAAVYDLSSPWLPPDHFDVIVNFRFLERATFPIYRSSLRRGGLLFFETYLQTNPDAVHPEYYLNPGELFRAFQDFDIIHWKEIDAPGIKRARAQLVARKGG